jgi:hypothetical protein
MIPSSGRDLNQHPPHCDPGRFRLISFHKIYSQDTYDMDDIWESVDTLLGFEVVEIE